MLFRPIGVSLAMLSGVGLLVVAASAEEIRHRVVCVDNHAHRLVLVDQVDPARGWSVAIPPGSRDLQLLPPGRLLVSHGNGAAEYDLATGKPAGWVVDRYSGVNSAQRLVNGNTLLAALSPKGVVFYEVDASGNEVAKVAYDGFQDVRLVRRLASGRTLFTCSHPTRAVEIDTSGKVVWEVALPGKGYLALRTPAGHTLVSTGGACSVMEFDAQRKLLTTWGAKETFPTLGLDWFSGFVQLSNGNILAANWLGHGKLGSGPHLVEFDRQNRLVWQWSDHQAAKVVTNVLVLDTP